MMNGKIVLAVTLACSIAVNLLTIGFLAMHVGKGTFAGPDAVSRLAIQEALEEQAVEYEARIASLNTQAERPQEPVTKAREEAKTTSYEPEEFSYSRRIKTLQRGRHPYAIQANYDEFDDATVHSVRLGDFRKQVTTGASFGLSALELELMAVTKGRENVMGLPQITLRIVATGTDSSGWLYLDCNHVRILSDKHRIEPSTDWDGSASTNLEFILVRLDEDEFVDMISGSSVRGKICNTEFYFTQEQLWAMRDFASRLVN